MTGVFLPYGYNSPDEARSSQGGAPLGSGVECLLPVSLRHDSVIGTRVLHAAVDRGSQGLSGALRTVPAEAVVSLAMELGLALERAETWSGAEGDGVGEEGVGGGETGLTVDGDADTTDESLPLPDEQWGADLNGDSCGGGGTQRSAPYARQHSQPGLQSNGQPSRPSQGSTLRSVLMRRSQQQSAAGTVAMDAPGALHRGVTASLEASSCSPRPHGKAPRAAAPFADWAYDKFLRWALRYKVFCGIARRKPWVVAVPVLLCLLLCGLGVFGVVYESDTYVDNQKAYVQEAVASATASAISNQLEIATFAIMAMSSYVIQQPLCTDLDRSFQNLSRVVLNWDEKGLVYQVQLLPAGVLRYIYPPVSEELAKLLIGRDMLQLDQYRNDTLYEIQQRDRRLLLGPYDLVEGFKGMFATYPIFLPAPDALYDWGCGLQPHDCPPGVCWLPEKGLKFWGLSMSLLSLDNMQDDFRFKALAQQGYRYRLYQLADNINHAATIAASRPPPARPVTATIRKFNLVWTLEVSPDGGWEPVWRGPCIATVVVGSVVVSALVLWLLMAREKHDALLNAMLPSKVIRQLQRGDQTVVEEFMEPVTILFTDIVSYTEVASQLTALQVVRLLNELYTRFDALCDKHGVYKVETIGDAFMCVAGCPAREDPVKAAVRMAGMAQDMIAMVERFSTRVGSEDMRVKIRIGLHSGPVVAGVIGQRMPRYCLFGDTVNTASRMETNSQPMCIHISAATASLLRMAGAAVMLPAQPPQPPPASALPPAPALQPAALPSPLRIGCDLEAGHRARPCGSGNLSFLLEQHDQASADLWQPHHGQREEQDGQQQGQQRTQEPQPPAQQISPAQAHAPEQQQAVGPGKREVGEAWRLAARGSPALVSPFTLFGRGRVMIKGKGMMHTFWLGSPPQPPADAPARRGGASISMVPAGLSPPASTAAGQARSLPPSRCSQPGPAEASIGALNVTAAAYAAGLAYGLAPDTVACPAEAGNATGRSETLPLDGMDVPHVRPSAQGRAEPSFAVVP